MGNYGATIRAGRTALGWSQEHLADEVGGISQSTVSRLELGLVDRTYGVLRDALSTRVRTTTAGGQMDVTAATALAALQELDSPASPRLKAAA